MKHITQITVAKADDGILGDIWGTIEDFFGSILDAIKGLFGGND